MCVPHGHGTRLTYGSFKPFVPNKGNIPMRTLSTGVAAAILAVTISGAAMAETFKLEAVMRPTQTIKYDFKDRPHFVFFVQREGKSEGSGRLAGASVTEFGMHDIRPGTDGDPRGYLVFRAANGDEAYVKWRVRAVFFDKDGGGKRIVDHGYWEIDGGTGQFKSMRGLGTLEIKGVNKTDRKFILQGELQ